MDDWIICPACAESNEKARSYCWRCYRDLGSPPTKADYGRLLGVKPGAGFKQIQTAYRRLAFKFHPDRNPRDKAAGARFKLINEAYANLTTGGRPEAAPAPDESRWRRARAAAPFARAGASQDEPTMKAHIRHKKPRIAGALSIIIPGTGQLYNGEIKKGLVYLGIWASVVILPGLWLGWINWGLFARLFDLVIAGFASLQAAEAARNSWGEF